MSGSQVRVGYGDLIRESNIFIDLILKIGYVYIILSYTILIATVPFSKEIRRIEFVSVSHFEDLLNKHSK